MQVSSWIAARVAVLVEFAVFLISSTTLFPDEPNLLLRRRIRGKRLAMKKKTVNLRIGRLFFAYIPLNISSNPIPMPSAIFFNMTIDTPCRPCSMCA